MKLNFKRLIFLIAIATFNLNAAFAVDSTINPPPPNGPGAPGGGPDTPPGLPLDSNVLIFLSLAIILGFYLISKRKKTIKT